MIGFKNTHLLGDSPDGVLYFVILFCSTLSIVLQDKEDDDYIFLLLPSQDILLTRAPF